MMKTNQFRVQGLAKHLNNMDCVDKYFFALLIITHLSRTRTHFNKDYDFNCALISLIACSNEVFVLMEFSTFSTPDITVE